MNERVTKKRYFFGTSGIEGRVSEKIGFAGLTVGVIDTMFVGLLVHFLRRRDTN